MVNFLRWLQISFFFLGAFVTYIARAFPFYTGLSNKYENATGNLMCDMHSVHPRFVGSGKAFNICLRPNDLIGRVIKGRDGYWPECKHFF